ncbi:MAG: copper amine oxidase N-terminal domain-containing protein [Clostridiaceae bacterium]|nr:copper amine oxidase N-terminal domain-containing protein [Clostridiaceae bacterium]
MLVVMCFSSLTTYAAIGDGAEQISVNKEVIDNLESKDAINNYKFELPTPGKVSITFEHENVEKSFSLWQIDMFDQNKDSVMNNYKSDGDVQSGETMVLYLDKGTYYVRVKGDSYGSFSSVDYNLCVNYTENLGEYEIEKNDVLENATVISEVNKPITGNLRTKEDIDFYEYTITNPGKVNIGFEHENVEKSYSLWQIDMFDSEQNSVMNNYKSKGDEQKGQSQNVYLKSGTYYIRVKGDSYGDSSSVEYNLCVNYTEDIGNHETELNDKRETANIITEMNKQITGNLRDSDDMDFFKFTTVSPGKVHLEFKHKDTEDWMDEWKITVYDDMDKVICELESDGTEESRRSEELDVLAGTYYVKVESGGYFNHSDYEYTLAINGTGSLENPIKVLLNGKQIQFDQPPIIQEGRTLVPLRAIFEAMEATVLWDDATKTVTSIKLETTIVLKIGDNILKKNSDEIELDVPAQIVNGRTLVPARAVAESFGADVGWDGATKTVIITQD